MSYFVSPQEETDWHLVPQEFSQQLTAAWPGIDVRAAESPDAYQSLEWTLDLDGSWVEGSLSKSGQAIHLDGDIEACARFALWVRTHVPTDQELSFYDEGYSHDVALHSSSRVEELVDPFV